MVTSADDRYSFFFLNNISTRCVGGMVNGFLIRKLTHFPDFTFNVCPGYGKVSPPPFPPTVKERAH